MATTAPSAPPEETPIIPGSAIGLRKSPCIVAPATPRAAPTEAPTIILGSLICSMTSCSVRPNSASSSPREDNTMEATWRTGISTGPMLSDTRAVARINKARMGEPMASRVVTPALRYPRSVVSPAAFNKNTSGGSPLEVVASLLRDNSTTQGPSLKRRAVTSRSGRSPGLRVGLCAGPFPIAPATVGSGSWFPLTVALPAAASHRLPYSPWMGT